MATIQQFGNDQRRQRPRRMTAVRTMSDSGKAGLCYPVSEADVAEGVRCVGCSEPFELGGYYAERPVGPNIAEIVCLSCAGRSQHAEAAPLEDAPRVYGQDRNLPDPEGWVAATIPVVVVEGMRTGDGRLIPADTLSGHRALPIPLLSLSRTTEGGHLEATVCGRIDHLERVPGPDVVNVDTGQPFPEGTFVWRSNEAYVDPEHPDYKLIFHGALSGLSVDLSETDAEFVEDEDDPEAEPLLQLLSGRLAASTVCTIPAFPGAHLVLDPAAPAPGGAKATEPIAASGFVSVRMDGEPVTGYGDSPIRMLWEHGAQGHPASTAGGPTTTAPSSAALSAGRSASGPSSPTAGASGRRAPAGSGSRSPSTAPRTASTSPSSRPVPSSTPRKDAARSASGTSSGTPAHTAATAPHGTRTSTTATSGNASARGSAARATGASAASSTGRTFSAGQPSTWTPTELPPIQWFRDPELTGPTPVTVENDGRCYGHIATWGTAHTGLPGRVQPPRSSCDYAYFHAGSARVEGDEGEVVSISVGHLTLDTGHADLGDDLRAASEHYDDTGSIAGYVCAGEDEHGIWFAGAVDPAIDELRLRRFMACGLSGDWRPIDGALELVAALSVPVPGFPLPRARVAAGRPVAIVAAGAIRPQKETEMAGPPPPTPPADEDAPPIEAGTPVVIGDSGLAGVVSDVQGDTAIVAVEVPVGDLTPADAEAGEMSEVKKVVDAMRGEIKTLRAQRVLDRV